MLCPWTHKIADLAIVARDGLFWFSIVTSLQLFCDVTRTRVTGIVTSYSSIVLARTNWRQGDLHLWITTVNIDFSPPGIHGLGCKKWCLLGLKGGMIIFSLLTAPPPLKERGQVILSQWIL